MEWDDVWVERFEQLTDRDVELARRKMMGGLCFTLDGHMVGGVGCSADGDHHMMFRVGKGNAEVAEALPGWEPVVKGGRRMGGMYLVDADAVSAEDLRSWMSLAVAHAQSLPPK